MVESVFMSYVYFVNGVSNDYYRNSSDLLGQLWDTLYLIWFVIDVDNLFLDDGLTQLKQVYVKETQRVVFTTDEKTEERTHKCLEVAYLFWILQCNMYICNLIL